MTCNACIDCIVQFLYNYSEATSKIRGSPILYTMTVSLIPAQYTSILVVYYS